MHTPLPDHASLGTGHSRRATPNVYLHHVFDLWARRWGRRQAHGDVVIVRFADDLVVGFQHRADAERFYADLVQRFARFGLETRFSITARSSPAYGDRQHRDDAWTPIHYPNAVWDEAEQRLISDAEIAEVPFTAFTSRRTADHISGRLIVRRVKRLNPTAKTATSVAGGDRQGELFALYRYHAVFTDSPLPLVQAEKTHRAHAIIEQVHADLRSGPLAHLPSGSFAANSAWLVLAAIAFNLTRAAGCLASAFHAKATTGTTRAQLINIPARLARSARRLRMHLPQHWPCEQAWSQLFQATLAPPRPA